MLIRWRPIPPPACALSGRRRLRHPSQHLREDGPERSGGAGFCRLAAKAPTAASSHELRRGMALRQRSGQTRMAPRSPRRRRAREPRQASSFSVQHKTMKVFAPTGGRGWTHRDRPTDRAADRAGGIVTPQGAETPRPLPAGGSVALIKRDRARPPEDEKVRGRARPALARSNVRGRLDNSACEAALLSCLKKESEHSEILDTVGRPEGTSCADWRDAPQRRQTG